jgi:hypothetical protein
MLRCRAVITSAPTTPGRRLYPLLPADGIKPLPPEGNQRGGLAHTREEMTPPRAASRRYFPTSPFKPPPAPPPADVFAVQDQVTHDKYGLGRVMSIEDGTSVVIDFHTHRVRILTPYARLTKL